MINSLHKTAVDMWILSKSEDIDSNPSIIIIQHLTGEVHQLSNYPENVVQLCQKINELENLDDLSEEDKIEIQDYAISAFRAKMNSNETIQAKAIGYSWINWIGYILGAISVGIGGLSWWIIGFGIGTWMANGAAKVSAHRGLTEQNSAWVMPVHIALHLICLLGLIGFSILNMT